MRTNRAVKEAPTFTHEGARAVRVTPEQQLRRTVMSCMLWEGEFYEDGDSIANRIKLLSSTVSPAKVAAIAVEARTVHNLRHVPLLLTATLAGVAGGSSLVSETLASVIQRPDELAEFVSIYAKINGVEANAVKPKLSNQVRKGLAQAFIKFNAYSLAKYNRDNAVKLRDVLFLCHAKAKNAEQEAVWGQLIDGTLPAPDTWEVELSAGKDKKATFERLIREGKLGYLALLRNLRNMVQAGVDAALVNEAILARKGGAERVLPFRYVAAARHAPMYEPALDKSLCTAIGELPAMHGSTVVLVDVSGSMGSRLSGKSEMTRMDAAATLASMLNAEQLRVFSFSSSVVEVPPRKGMAGVDAIIRSQGHGGTRMIEAVDYINREIPHDRLIVITDEQTAIESWIPRKGLPAPVCQNAYVINVASARNGVGYGPWTHLDGFSEHVLRWIMAYESE
jgi:60 kDa SS-A/Ro ribonucleoprotein